MDMASSALADALPPQDVPVTAPTSPVAPSTGADQLPSLRAWPQPEGDQSEASGPVREKRATRPPKHRRHPTLHTPNLPIPDLRFEQSFLASIRSCIVVYPDNASDVVEKKPGPSESVVGETPAPATEWWVAKNIKVRWSALLHKIFVTQFISQPLSGAVFFVLGLGWTTARLGLRSALRKPGWIARPPPLAQ